MSVATFMNRLAATAMASTMLTSKTVLTYAGLFLLLSVVCLLLLAFLFFFLPETKGRSLEDMSLYFAEITGDFTLLDAERKIRVEQELQQISSGTGGGGGSSGPPGNEPTVPVAAEGGTMT